jgi:ABC-2 type transport system permease protein
MTTLALVRKLLRDLRWPLLVVMLLLCGFELLWYRVAQRITTQLSPFFQGLASAQRLAPGTVEQQLFRGPGKVMQTLIGGESLNFERAMDTLAIGYVHPLVQTLLCIWAVGRTAGAIAGELDRGTLELLLAQPLPRWRLILAHFLVDLCVIPLVCLALWSGTLLGTQILGPFTIDEETLRAFRLPQVSSHTLLDIDAIAFGKGLWNVAGLLFALSGVTMVLSAVGRFRNRVLAVAVLLTVLQFLINLIGQLWETVAFLRPLTVFYYYQPQRITLTGTWTVDPGEVWGGQPLVSLNVLAVLVTVGAAGYLAALWIFSRRDLPAPL